jgi:hypothetical protein
MQMDGFPLSSNRQERLFPGILSGCPTTGKPRQGSGTGFLAPVMEFIPPTAAHGPERIGKGTIIPAGRKQHIAVDAMGFLLTVVVHSAGIQDRIVLALAPSYQPTYQTLHNTNYAFFTRHSSERFAPSFNVLAQPSFGMPIVRVSQIPTQQP